MMVGAKHDKVVNAVAPAFSAGDDVMYGDRDIKATYHAPVGHVAKAIIASLGVGSRAGFIGASSRTESGLSRSIGPYLELGTTVLTKLCLWGQIFSRTVAGMVSAVSAALRAVVAFAAELRWPPLELATALRTCDRDPAIPYCLLVCKVTRPATEHLIRLTVVPISLAWHELSAAVLAVGHSVLLLVNDTTRLSATRC